MCYYSYPFVKSALLELPLNLLRTTTKVSIQRRFSDGWPSSQVSPTKMHALGEALESRIRRSGLCERAPGKSNGYEDERHEPPEPGEASEQCRKLRQSLNGPDHRKKSGDDGAGGDECSGFAPESAWALERKAAHEYPLQKNQDAEDCVDATAKRHDAHGRTTV